MQIDPVTGFIAQNLQLVLSLYLAALERTKKKAASRLGRGLFF